MSKFICIVLCAVVAILSNVASGQSLSESLKPSIEKCSQKHGVSNADVQAAKAAGNSDGVDPCFIDCVFKEAGIFNTQGQYDLDTSRKNLKQAVKDEVQYKNLEDVFTKCAIIKDKPVSSEHGCERAALLARCLLDHKTSILI